MVNFLPQQFLIYRIIAGQPPLVCKKQTMGYAGHGEFGNREVHFFRSQLDGLIHIVDTEMFADEAKKVFGPAGDDDLTAFLIHKSAPALVLKSRA